MLEISLSPKTPIVDLELANLSGAVCMQEKQLLCCSTCHISQYYLMLSCFRPKNLLYQTHPILCIAEALLSNNWPYHVREIADIAIIMQYEYWSRVEKT